MIFNTLSGGGSNGIVWKPCNKKNGFNVYSDSDTINLEYAQIGNLVLMRGNFTVDYNSGFLYSSNPLLIPKGDSVKIFNNDGTQYIRIFKQSISSVEISASSKNMNISIGGFYETY